MAEKEIVRTETRARAVPGRAVQPGDQGGRPRLRRRPGRPRAGRAAADRQAIAEQTEQVLRNLGAILEAAGSGLDQLVKTTVFLQTSTTSRR